MVKEQLAAGYDVFGQSLQKPPRVERARSTRPTPESAEALKDDGSILVTPSIAIQDALMRADWYFVNEDNENAKALYTMARAAATGTFAEIRYDGTTAANAAAIGLLKVDAALAETHTYLPDDSFKASELTLLLYIAATTDVQRSVFDIEQAMMILPPAHETVFATLKKKIDIYQEKQLYDDILLLCSNIYARKAFVDTYFTYMSDIYNMRGELDKMFDIFIMALETPRLPEYTMWFRTFCVYTWGWANNDALLRYSDAQAISRLLRMLGGIDGPQIEVRGGAFMLPDKWRERWYRPEMALREALKNNDFESVGALLDNELRNSVQISHVFTRGLYYLHSEKMNEALTHFMRAYNERTRRNNRIPINHIFPTTETAYMEKCLSDEDSTNRYIEWLETRMDQSVQYGDTNTTLRIEARLNELRK